MPTSDHVVYLPLTKRDENAMEHRERSAESNGVVDCLMEEQGYHRCIRPSLGFIPALEGLRGVAILMVIYCHTSNVTLNPFDDFIGAAGVSMFFVLSGFLITGILIKSQKISSRHGHLPRFYADRAVRLLPALLPLFIYVWYRCQLRNDGSSLIARWMFRCVFYLENQNTILYIEDFHQHPMKHFWSLSCEEQFYIIWSLVLPYIIAIKTTKGRVSIMLLLILSSTWTAYYAATVPDAIWGMHYYEGFLANLYKLLIGSTLRLVPLPDFFFSKSARYFAYIAIFSTIGMAYHINNDGVRMWGAGVLALFSSLLITSSIAENSNHQDWFLCNSLLRFFGRVSYSLYVWHYAILRLDDVAFLKRKEGLYSCAVALCFSTFSTLYYEEPLRFRYAQWKSAE